jgi:hypothetical protein
MFWKYIEAIMNSIDIGEMLNKGEQPVHKILTAVKNFNDNEIL